jgi:alpha-galactosidase
MKTDLHLWQPLTPSEELAANRVVEAAQVNRNAELESVANAQAQKIMKLEASCASLR